MLDRKTVFEIAFLVFAVIFLVCFDVVIIDGPSMLPSYYSGQRVLSGLPLHIKNGDVVLVHMVDNGERTIFIKRVSWIKNNEVYLLGDNPRQSLDSRDLGPFPTSSIVGKIVYPIVPLEPFFKK